MRIVHITTGLGNGGAERTLYKLASEDRKNSHSVISLTSGGYFKQKLADRGIPVVTLGMNKNITGFFSVLVQLHALLSAEKVEIVQTWMYHSDFLGGLAARFSGIENIVWNVRSSNPNLKNSNVLTFFLTRVLGLLSHAIPKAIIYVALTARADHEAIGYSKNKGVVIQNGYDLKAYKRSSRARQKVRTALGIGLSSTLIGLVARFHPKKNHAGFLRACQDLQSLGMDFQVLLVGHHISSRNAILEESIQNTNMQDRVLMLEEVPNVAEVMTALDILVSPSSNGEGFPNVIAEAMLCETPCVVSTSGDSSEIVGLNGWIFPAGSHSLLVDSLRQAIESPPSRLWAMGKRARSFIVENFSQDKMVKKYQDLYLSIVEDE